MPTNCCVPGCLKSTHTTTILTFHAFPSDPVQRAGWLERIGLQDVKEWYRICSRHFITPTDFERDIRSELTGRNWCSL